MYVGRAKLLMDNYLLHNNNLFLNNRSRKLDLISKSITTPIYDESRRLLLLQLLHNNWQF